jgi:hypothetical protein
VRAFLSNNGWKICFLILSIQYLHYALGSTACADWLLSKTGIFSECPGNPRFELQIDDVPHGWEDLVYCCCLLLEVQFYPMVVHGLLAYYEVIHWRLLPWAVLDNVRLKAYLFAG